MRILFIGNSLTMSNALPELVRSVASLTNDVVTVHTEASGGTALIDHLNGATMAVSALKERQWDFVVLQQGPTPRGVCRDSLVLWTRMFDPLIKASGARTALMMTWPRIAARPDLFDEVLVSFQQAAMAVNGTFLPAGEAWRIAWSMDPELPLYSDDGFHPSGLGSLLAAIEIHGRLSGRDVRKISIERLAAIAPQGTSEGQLWILLEAAQRANERFTNSGGESPTFEPAQFTTNALQTC